MDPPPLLRIPEQFRHPSEVLVVAAQLDLPNIVLLSMNDEGLLILNAGDGIPLTEAQVLYLLERARQSLLNRAWARGPANSA
jgi:hypothetical protein